MPRSTDISAAAARHIPLKPVVLHILLALAHGDLHGYGIIQVVREQSEERIRLRTGAFYRHLAKLLDAGLVEPTHSRPANDDPRRGAYYRITALGRHVLTAEVRRLSNLVTLSRQMGLAGKRPWT